MRTILEAMSVAAIAALVAAAAGCGGRQTTAPESAPAGEPETATQGGGAQPSGTSTVTGTVRYEGDVPTLKAINMSADPGCAVKHEGPVKSQVLVLGEGNTMANVIVHVKSGLPEQSWAVPSEPVVLDQNGCRYKPHVLSLMAGQTLKILNSDGLLHNVHALPKVNRTFNMAMPASRTEATHVFEKPEDPFFVKCDVHPWMGAYVGVMSHPYHAVTGPDGSFEIDRLPAGSYELEAWHEKLGTLTASVSVAEGATETSDFTFTR